MTVPPSKTQRGAVGLIASAAALLIALILMNLLIAWLRTGPLYDGHIVLLWSYGIIWVPFSAAVIFSCASSNSSSSAILGLRITLFDVFLGVGAGLLARAIAGIIEIAATGRMNGLGVTFGDTVYDGWWVFGTILAPVLVAPFIEELFFRGLLQRAVLRATSTRLEPRSGAALSIGLSAVLFGLLHVTQAASPTGALVLGLSAFSFGLAAALIAGFTGRIGGAIVAHVVFNGALVFSSLL